MADTFELQVAMDRLPTVYFAATSGRAIYRGASSLLVFIAEGTHGKPPAMEIILPPSGLSLFVRQVGDLLDQTPELKANRPKLKAGASRPENWERIGVPLGAQVLTVTRVGDLAALNFYLVSVLLQRDGPHQTFVNPVITCALDLWALEALHKEAVPLLKDKNALALGIIERAVAPSGTESK